MCIRDSGYIAALKTKTNDFDFAHSDVISTDVWFAKISFSGEVIWKKRMVGSKEENLPKVFKSDDNTFFALINSNSTDSDFVKNISPDATKGFVFNIDSEGNEIMNYMVESTDISFPTSIFDAQLVDGNIIIAGEEKYLHGLPLYRLYNFCLLYTSRCV